MRMKDSNLNSLFASLLVSIALVGCAKDEEKGCLNAAATNYEADADVHDPCCCKYDGLTPACGTLDPTAMDIPAVGQETAVWCWLACGEMVFRHYGLPTVNPAGDYQCGIVGAVGYSLNGACDACNINCGNCVRPAGDASMITYMISVYPEIACRDLFTSGTTLHSTFVAAPVSEAEIIAQIDANRPIIAGINPGSQFILPGNSQHVAVIKGYTGGVGNLSVVVNDPWPLYGAQGDDPYDRPGVTNNGLVHVVPYATFIALAPVGLGWNTTWKDIDWN